MAAEAAEEGASNLSPLDAVVRSRAGSKASASAALPNAFEESRADPRSSGNKESAASLTSVEESRGGSKDSAFLPASPASVEESRKNSKESAASPTPLEESQGDPRSSGSKDSAFGSPAEKVLSKAPSSLDFLEESRVDALPSGSKESPALLESVSSKETPARSSRERAAAPTLPEESPPAILSESKESAFGDPAPASLEESPGDPLSSGSKEIGSMIANYMMIRRSKSDRRVHV